MLDDVSHSLEAIGSSFLLVAASEMGDKTQLLAFSLAARFRKPWVVMAGILVATLVNHGLASTLGALVAAHVPPVWMALSVGVAFLAFGLWALKPDDADDDEKPARFGPFLTTVFLFFIAEMGDKTQLATIALAARFQSAILVTTGTTLGMMLTDGLAVFLGDCLAGKVQNKWVRIAAAALFFMFGAVSLFSAYTLWTAPSST